jgi:hypothetical protein
MRNVAKAAFTTALMTVTALFATYGVERAMGHHAVASTSTGSPTVACPVEDEARINGNCRPIDSIRNDHLYKATKHVAALPCEEGAVTVVKTTLSASISCPARQLSQ